MGYPRSALGSLERPTIRWEDEPRGQPTLRPRAWGEPPPHSLRRRGAARAPTRQGPERSGFKLVGTLGLCVAIGCGATDGASPSAGGGAGTAGATASGGAAAPTGGGGATATSGGAAQTSGTAGSGNSSGSGGADEPDPGASAGGAEGGANADSAGADAGGAAGAGGTTAGGGGGSGAAGSGGLAGAGNVPKCPAGPFPAPQAGAATTICPGFAYRYGFNEGPTWLDREQAFFFSNFIVRAPNGDTRGDIIKYTPGTGCERVFEDVGTNGLAVSKDGKLLAASHRTRNVLLFDLVTKMPTVVVDSYMGQMFDTPNDLVQSSSGSIYFTNPNYELGGRPPGVGLAVFWLDAANKLTAIKQGGASPNGIALSPDEKRLYVVGAGLYDVDPSGAPSNLRSFPLDADGIAVDCAGNVYLSGGTIVSPSGTNIGTFPRGTNMAFGGADHKTLLIAGNNTLARTVQMNLPGLP